MRYGLREKKNDILSMKLSSRASLPDWSLEYNVLVKVKIKLDQSYNLLY